jgi:uncharacterized repeat protein (TIGR03803 family)
MYPQGGLIMDSAGNLYGTTYAGGIGRGTVFKISAAGTETVLYSFGSNGANDGINPTAGLIMDSAGNLYGTTSLGGAFDQSGGTVFKIAADGTESILHSFGGPGDGGSPRAGLIMDSAGNLYGTNSGTVFKISPDGTESNLHFFGGTNDGMSVYGGVIMDSAGNLYGTTTAGGVGIYTFGTVFKISAAGTESVLYTFDTTGNDGAEPFAGLIMDSAGNLYGTTKYGGNGTLLLQGTVFKITAAGAESILHAFPSGPTDGGYPVSPLIMDSNGNLFGTTPSGGQNKLGTVFKISSAGAESVLYSFAGATTDGNEPSSGLIVDSAGNLYGTTGIGGAYDAGTVFRID